MSKNSCVLSQSKHFCHLFLLSATCWDAFVCLSEPGEPEVKWNNCPIKAWVGGKMLSTPHPTYCTHILTPHPPWTQINQMCSAAQPEGSKPSDNCDGGAVPRGAMQEGVKWSIRGVSKMQKHGQPLPGCYRRWPLWLMSRSFLCLCQTESPPPPPTPTAEWIQPTQGKRKQESDQTGCLKGVLVSYRQPFIFYQTLKTSNKTSFLLIEASLLRDSSWEQQ